MADIRRKVLTARAGGRGMDGALPPRERGIRVQGKLPPELTSFVGRRDDLAAVARLLSDGRLATLTRARSTNTPPTSITARALRRERPATCFGTT